MRRLGLYSWRAWCTPGVCKIDPATGEIIPTGKRALGKGEQPAPANASVVGDYLLFKKISADIGIDPDLHGGVAVIDSALNVLGVADTPTASINGRTIYNTGFGRTLTWWS